MTRTLLTSVVGLVAFVAILWLLGQAIGYEFSLWGSLGLSIVATIVLNVLLYGFRRPRR